MNITHIHNYVFLPCIAGEHRYCRAEYKTQYNTALGEVEAGHCICPCHLERGKGRVKQGIAGGPPDTDFAATTAEPRKETSEQQHQKPQTQTGNARKVRG